MPACRVVATDVSADALDGRAAATRSATAWRTASSSSPRRTSTASTACSTSSSANPPYVKDGDKPALSRDVRHEPDVALFGGAEGLRDIAGVLDTAAARSSTPGGWLVMEFGYGQEDDVRELVARDGRAPPGSRARRPAGHTPNRYHSAPMSDCLFCKIIAGEIPAPSSTRTTRWWPSRTSIRRRRCTC